MDPYAILKIQNNASDTDMKKAYRTQMLQLHPDKLPPDLTAEEIAAVTDKFHMVKDAYEFLTNAQYLTARRLYMTKVASRRAEYERREAFLRRQQNSANRSSASDPIPTRVNTSTSNNVYQQYSHRHHGHRNNGNRPPPQPSRSYAIPPRRKSENNLNEKYGKSEPNLRQGKSEPNFNPGYGTKYGRGQSNGKRQVHKMGGVSQTRKYKGGADVNATRGRGREAAGTTANKDTNRASSRAKRTKSSSAARKKEGSRRRARSQPPSSRSKSRDAARFSNAGVGGSQGSNKENRRQSSSNDKRRSRRMARDGDRRVRSRSAPARYYSKNKTDQSVSTRRASNRELPEEFFCPLTKRIMKDPVVDNDGHTYEREAIERWLRAQSSSPVTNEYLSLDMLKPNKKLKSKIYKATGEYIDDC